MATTPVRYQRDDARRRVVVTVEGAFQTSDVTAITGRQRAEDTWSYGMLYDLRHVTGRSTLADLREIMGQSTAHRPAEPPRGPVAILVTDPKMYGIACTYAALGLSKLTMRVFRDLEDAESWLAAETSDAD